MQSVQEHPTFQRLQRQRFIHGFLLGALSLITLYVVLSIGLQPDLDNAWGGTLSWTMWRGEGWWELVLAFAFIGYATLKSTGAMVESDKMVQIYPSTETEKELAYDVVRIREETLALAKEMGVSVEEIYIAMESIPNAFAAMAIERGDILVLHSNLIEILDEASLRSIIAHELGHMAGNDVLHKLGTMLPQKVTQILLVLLYIQMTGLLLLSETFSQVLYRGFALLMVMFLSQLWLGMINRFDLMYSRSKEMMADMYGAFYTSAEASINSFVRLNARAHALQTFVDALKKQKNIDMTILASAVDHFPYGSPSGDTIAALAPKCYAQAHLRSLCSTLSIELPSEIETQLIEQLLQHHVPSESSEESTSEENDSAERSVPFSWKHFDQNQDGVLQREEIQVMLTALDADPMALTDEEGDSGTHPSNRTRVLFLAEAFGISKKALG